MLFCHLLWERSGSVVECLTRDRRAAGSSLRRHCVVSLSKNINPSLVLVQPRKTRPYITERLLMGRKESNQNKKSHLLFFSKLSFQKIIPGIPSVSKVWDPFQAGHSVWPGLGPNCLLRLLADDKSRQSVDP